MSQRKVLPLVGYKSLRALNVYSVLILGMKLLPAYQSLSYEEFLKIVEAMDTDGQRKIFREGASFVELAHDELKAIICFCTDKNGVPYMEENLKSLSPVELVEVIVDVCMELVKIKIDFVTEAEKKK